MVTGGPLFIMVLSSAKAVIAFSGGSSLWFCQEVHQGVGFVVLEQEIFSGLGRFKYVRRVRFIDVSSARWEIKDLLTECVATWGGAGAFTDHIIGLSTPLVMFLSSPG
ncbi:hypothetical protein F2Q68_00010625 [Brassica cretica]|uniref:Uncharacterized protein n=1 Tax=Brassica cretica TaxID=69181 RepID=A0A8S9L2F6_BRACR|nr:hypothetical protein F2Q68_00010625 [Brassica cretica]